MMNKMARYVPSLFYSLVGTITIRPKNFQHKERAGWPEYDKSPHPNLGYRESFLEFPAIIPFRKACG